MKKILKICIYIILAFYLVFYLVPTKAPNVYLNFIDGQEFQIKSFEGNPLLVTFWSTTCAICLEEIPRLAKLYEELNEYGFEIIAIAVSNDPPNRVVELSKNKKIPYRVALDINADAEKAFGKIRYTPTNFLIDRNGKIIKRYVGKMEINKLRSKIKRLLNT